MFYKRRNLQTVVNGRNPIAQHEYLGTDVEGKNIIIVDDLLASGESVLDTVRELNERGAAKIFVMVTFGQFTAGPEKVRRALRRRQADGRILHEPDLCPA